MASDYLLEIDGIKGESKDKKHPNTIEIESWSWGVSNTSGRVPAAGGQGSGKASFQDLHFTSSVSKASPLLMLACASGKHIPRATLYVRKSTQVDPTQTDYYQVTLTDILISSYQSHTSQTTGILIGLNQPGDAFSINFAKIEYGYRQEDPPGTFLPAVQVGWDRRTGQPVTPQP